MSKEFNLTQVAEINESLIENQLPQLDEAQSRMAGGQNIEIAQAEQSSTNLNNGRL